MTIFNKIKFKLIILYSLFVFTNLHSSNTAELGEVEETSKYNYSLQDISWIEVFSNLDVVGICKVESVSRKWHKLSQDPDVWRGVRKVMHGYYPETESSKEMARIHWLRVLAFAQLTPEKMSTIIDKYQLTSFYMDSVFTFENSFLLQILVFEIKEFNNLHTHNSEELTSFLDTQQFLSFAAEDFQKELVHEVGLNLKFSSRKEVIEYYCNKRLVPAIEMKIEGLRKGIDGFEICEQDAKKLEEFIRIRPSFKRNLVEFKSCKCPDNKQDDYKTSCNPLLEADYDAHIANGSEIAVIVKFMHILYYHTGCNNFKPPNIKEVRVLNRTAAIQFIEEMIEKKHRVALYLKAVFMHLGVFDYRHDPAAIRQFILGNYIPY